MYGRTDGKVENMRNLHLSQICENKYRLSIDINVLIVFGSS